jgi:virginiamycin B lyase
VSAATVVGGAASIHPIHWRAWVLRGALSIVAVTAAFLLIWRVGPWRPMSFAERRLANAGDIPAAVALGPDGAVWFTLDNADAIGVLRGDSIQRIPKTSENLEPLGLAVAPDGGVWFTDAVAEAIGHLSPDGTFESFPLPTPVTQFGRLAVARDDAIWAADSWSNSVVRLKDGNLVTYPLAAAGAAPFGIAADLDGGVWATLQAVNKLVHVDASGQITDFEPPTRSSGPSDVAVDSSGGVWLVELRAGKIAHYAAGSPSCCPTSLVICVTARSTSSSCHATMPGHSACGWLPTAVFGTRI